MSNGSGVCIFHILKFQGYKECILRTCNLEGNIEAFSQDVNVPVNCTPVYKQQGNTNPYKEIDVFEKVK